jgi:hypothetical protein
MTFKTTVEANHRSMEVFNCLREYDDFLESLQSVVDLGCGQGQDLEWWATAATREESPRPLNIPCVGIDMIDTPAVARKYANITYQRVDFESDFQPQKTNFDLLWCNDAFQYCVNPIGTLSKWWHMASAGAMIILIVPQTTNFQQKRQVFYQPSGCYYHHSLISLIHMLAVTGWDCKSGFFLQKPNDPCNYAVAYKSQHQPMDPKQVDWYQLQELKLLPDSVDKSVQAHGYPVQTDLILPWLNKSFVCYG